MDRDVHARGKSLRDLILQRRGQLTRIPDVVVRPGSEHQVSDVMRAALEHDAVLIPFGGGSSISGSLEAPGDEMRPVISVDLARLDRLLEIDGPSRLARAQAGVSGPDLEEQLAARGYTLGHFPDSFPHSTLGGWIATRSSGMQSDRYGDIADLAKGLRVVTPSGTLVTRPVPATSTGPSVRQMVLGSEGRLGIITEATVEVRRLPEKRIILGYLFPTFAAGLAAMRAIAESECSVSVTRVSDARETQFSFATRKTPTLLDKLQSRALREFLVRRLGFDVEAMALSFIGYEGSDAHVARERKAVGKIVKAHGGLCIGSGPGALYDQKKFDTPYIRDFLLDRGVAGDVSETAMPWSRLTPVYDAVVAAAERAFDDLGVMGYVMCHLSHSYHAGACLYFTFAFPPSPGGDMLAEYDVVKSAIQQAFVDNGATLSHHHAVGTEHARWLGQDISEPGVEMLKALFAGTDPGRHLNPGKIV
jgi:alkyldihydroxyacetonephosphate synthase